MDYKEMKLADEFEKFKMRQNNKKNGLAYSDEFKKTIMDAHKNGHNVPYLARLYGVSAGTIYNWVGLPMRRSEEQRQKNGNRYSELAKRIVVKEYQCGASRDQLSIKYGVNRSSITKWVKKYRASNANEMKTATGAVCDNLWRIGEIMSEPFQTAKDHTHFITPQKCSNCTCDNQEHGTPKHTQNKSKLDPLKNMVESSDYDGAYMSVSMDIDGAVYTLSKAK